MDTIDKTPFSSSHSHLTEQLASLHEAVSQKLLDSEVQSRIQTVFTTVVCDGNLWKEFKKWTKEHVSHETLTPETRLDRSNVAGLIDSVSTTILTNIATLENLNERLLEVEQLHSGHLPQQPDATPTASSTQSTTIFDTLGEFDRKFLLHAIEKNHRKFEKALVMVQLYADLAQHAPSKEQRTYYAELRDNLQVWILQYLAKGSKTPLLEQKGPIHLPFLEYRSTNLAEYYRHDGGAIAHLLIEHLKQRNNFPTDRADYVLEVIKAEGFALIAPIACTNLGIKYAGELDSIDSIPKDSMDIEEQPTFYDITPLLENAYAQESGIGIMHVLNELATRSESSPTKLFFGGTILIDKQPCYILFPKEGTEPLVNHIWQLRGSLGLVPEISQIRRKLVETEYPLEQLLEPIRQHKAWKAKPMQLEASYEQIKTALERIRSVPIPQNTQLAKTYVTLFTTLVQHIEQTLANDPQLTTLHHLGPLNSSLQSIEKRLRNINDIDSLQSMNPGKQFQEILQEVHLITEELSLALCFCQFSPTSLSPLSQLLCNAVDALSPQSIHKSSYVCTSGMACFRHVIDSLVTAYNQKPFNLAFLDGSYYEFTSEQEFGAYLQNVAQCQSCEAEEFKNTLQSYDVLCMDIFPNFAPLDAIIKTPAIEIITQQLQLREKEAPPLTVILDTSTCLFFDSHVASIVKAFSEAIDEGKLNLVIVSSLAKFSMAGLDKYTGGIIQTYSNLSAMTDFADFSKHLAQETNKDIPSIEAAKFFLLFMQDGGKSLQHYLALINENTQSIYDMLEPVLTSDTPLCVKKREAEVPMLSLSFKKCVEMLFGEPLTINQFMQSTQREHIFTFFMQYFLSAKALHEGIPNTTRISFGFPVINFTECSTALRITMGLEDTPLLKAFSQLLVDISGNLENDLTTLQSSKYLYLFDYGGDYVKDWVERNKAAFIDYAKGHTFLQLLDFLYKKAGPETMLAKLVPEHIYTQNPEWILKHNKVLLNFAKDHPAAELEQFITLKLLPLEELVEDTPYVNGSFFTWIRKNSALFAEYLTNHDLVTVESYMSKAFYCHTTKSNAFDSFSNGSPTYQKWLTEFEEESIEYAKDHSLEELGDFLHTLMIISYLVAKSDLLYDQDNTWLDRHALVDLAKQENPQQALYEYLKENFSNSMTLAFTERLNKITKPAIPPDLPGTNPKG